MKWISTKTALPKDKEEVLIRAGGTINLAIYEKADKGFRLRSGDLMKTEHFIIEWVRLIAP